MHNYFTHPTPFHTITTVGGGMINLALIPFNYHHHRKGRTVNYTILVLPRKEYQRNGNTGAVTRIVRADIL